MVELCLHCTGVVLLHMCVRALCTHTQKCSGRVLLCRACYACARAGCKSLTPPINIVWVLLNVCRPTWCQHLAPLL